jgi:DNA-binding transcriptional LysR family regulator
VEWDDLRFFLAVARRGTLSAAARALGVSQPTVGRRIAALERQLGAVLFTRRPDGLSLAAPGEQVLAHAERVEMEVLAVERRVAGRDEGIRGKVRVTASEWLVTSVLSSAIAPLLARHPQLTLELVADPRHANLARREADIALRPRRFDQQGIVQRAVAKIELGLYAAPAYLAARSAPRGGDGRGHAWIAMSDDVGDLARAWSSAVLPDAKTVVRTNGRDAMLSLAVAGVGLACLARVAGDGAAGLQRVHITPPPPIATLWMGMHRDGRQTPRLRAVAAHLVDAFGALGPRLAPRA